MKLFGDFFKSNKVDKKTGETFVSPVDVQDGASVIIASGGAQNAYIDLNNSSENDKQLINNYRAMARNAECGEAIDNIITEAIVSNEHSQIDITLNLDKITEGLSDKVKEVMVTEFDTILNLLDMNTSGYDIFRNWYVDARIIYHMVPFTNASNGLSKLVYIDPRKIRKVKEVEEVANIEVGTTITKEVRTFYIYNEIEKYRGTSGIQVSEDAIATVNSGLYNNSNMIIGHLDKAIKPCNQLSKLEDAVVIYRLARAPERRIFYIDVGNMPSNKANNYINTFMKNFRTKIEYDATTGEVTSKHNHINMLEDFWLPRREGGRGTEVETLSGGQNLGEMDDVTYFQRKMYKSLNVPMSRLDSESMFNIGRSQEITRDELKFTMFINRLRNKFSGLFLKILKTQLILKKIITEDEWNTYKHDIVFDFVKNNYFTELKEAEMLRDRVSLLSDMENYVGSYFSREYIQKNVLQLTDEDIKEIDKQIADEIKSGTIAKPGEDDI